MTDGYMDSDILEYGVSPPVPEDYDTAEAYLEAYDAWFLGFQVFVTGKHEAAAREEEEARRRAAEAAAQAAREEEEAADQAAREEEEARTHQGAAQLPENPEPSDQYSVGSYIDAAGNVWSPSGELLSGDGALADSYVDQAGHLWSMEYSAPMEEQPLMEGDVSTGEPVVDTALLLLDLVDALTGEEGMVSDVGGMQQVLDHPLMTTSFQDYTVTEGLLLLLLLSVFIAACAKMLKEGFAWLR